MARCSRQTRTPSLARTTDSCVAAHECAWDGATPPSTKRGKMECISGGGGGDGSSFMRGTLSRNAVMATRASVLESRRDGDRRNRASGRAQPEPERRAEGEEMAVWQAQEARWPTTAKMRTAPAAASEACFSRSKFSVQSSSVNSRCRDRCLRKSWRTVEHGGAGRAQVSPPRSAQSARQQRCNQTIGRSRPRRGLREGVPTHARHHGRALVPALMRPGMRCTPA